MFPYIPLAPGVFIPSYFLVISLLYVICTYWLFKRAEFRQISQKYVLDLSLIIMVTGFLGGRLFHVLFEHPDYYSKAPMQIFKFWQGGFVFYGGAILAIVVSVLYLRRKQQKLSEWMNLFAPVVALGYILGRFATLLSGSGFGRPTNLPWGIVYPQGPEAPGGIALHPTPIYSMLWNGMALIFILWAERSRSRFFFKGSLLYFYGVFHGFGRLIIEQFRDDFRGGDYMGFSISSWISLLIIAFCVTMLIKGFERKP